METGAGPGDGEGPAAGQPPPPPSPLSGAYLLILVGEPHTPAHKDDILRKIANGFLSWDLENCHVDLDKELQAIISQAPEGEEARNGERLIQFASENLVTEVLIQPQLNTLIQCVRNLLSSFTKHRHIIHAGYTFAGNGSWIVQDGTFSLADLIDAFQETEVQRVLRAYENSVTVDIHCAPEGDWSTARLRREGFSKVCKVRVNPDDCPSPAASIQQFVDYLAPFVRTASIEQLLEPSDVVGNIRFSHPTLYVFPGGQGDAALFGINGFNMLVDGGFARKACFWDFARHLDRLDAVLMTRLNNSNINGLASVLRRKKISHVYPQIGHFFCNLQERKQPSTPDDEKVRDPLLVSLLDEGHEVLQNLRHLQLKPHHCVRDSVLEPINLYHKVGHGKLDMYVISPGKDSKELKEFLSKWHSNDSSLFSSVSKKPGDKDITFPLQNLVSICALLVWQPANPEDTITRILFPGSTPQHKIFEGLEKLRSLEFMKQPVCTAKTLSPSSSTIGISTKVSKIKSTPAVIDKLLPGEGLSKPIPKNIPQNESSTKQNVAKTATIPVSGAGDPKPKTTLPPVQKQMKPKQEKPKVDNKTETDKNIEVDSGIIPKQEKSIISDQVKEKESGKLKTDKQKSEQKPKKIESKAPSKTTEKKMTTKSSSMEKKDSVKSSPTTPKKSVEAKVNGVATKSEIIKSTSKPSNKTRTSPSATPAKSAKEENNRKVVESKVKAAIASKPAVGKPPKREESLPRPKSEKKPTKKSTSSPVKLPSKTFSPVKAATKTVSKSKKEPKKTKVENEKGIVTDSSTVSTPSTIDAETAITKEERVDDKDKVVEKGLEKDLTEVKEKEKIEDDTSKDIDETIETKEDTSICEGEAAKKNEQERPVDSSEREEEEDEILIIEKVEIETYGEDSMQDQESLESHIPDEGEDEIQKHLRDEAESEKKKDITTAGVDTQDDGEKESLVEVDGNVDQKDTIHEKTDKQDDLQQEADHTVPKDLPLSLNVDVREKVLTPENREQIEEEVQEIITSATDFVAKAKQEQSKESSELSAEGVGSDEQKTSGETKDPLSSPEKLNILSDKNFTDEDNKQDGSKDKSKELGDGRYGAEESQPDEKFSTTVESGATTAPTLPEDERIPLDEIKEGVEETYDKEDTKEKDVAIPQGRIDQPTTLPQVSVIPGGAFDAQANNMLPRDIVKTPDEVADLPVHEEVDGVYEDDDFSRDGSKSKEDLLNIVSGKKDVDTKEDEVLETPLAQPKDEQLPTQTEVKGLLKDASPEEEVPKDVKTDEDELKELKIIRQRLEEEDSIPQGISSYLHPVPEKVEKELQEEDKNNKGSICGGEVKICRSEVGDLLVEELVHSTLKAPEVAELVLVTPDSAPESPLHLLGEKKVVESKEVSGLSMKEEQTQQHRVLAGIQQEGEQVIDSLTQKSKDTVPSGTVQNELEDQNILTDIQTDPQDIMKEPKVAVETPKTPPASPVVEEIEKGKNTETFEIIPEANEPVELDKPSLDDATQIISQNTIDSAISSKHLNGAKETLEDGLETKFPSTSSKRASVKEEETGVVTSNITEKHVSPKSVSPTPSDVKNVEKEKIKLLDDKHDIPCEVTQALTDKTMDKGRLEESIKLESPKSVSPVLSDKNGTTILEQDKQNELKDTHDKLKSVTPITSEKEKVIQLEENETKSVEQTTQETSKTISPVTIDSEETKDSAKGSPTLTDHAHDQVVSPVPTEKEDMSYSLDDKTTLEHVTQETTKIMPKSISPVPNETEDVKIMEEKETFAEDIMEETSKRTSPPPSDKDHPTSLDMDKLHLDTENEALSTSSALSDKDQEKSKDVDILHLTEDRRGSTPKISQIPSEKDAAKQLVEDEGKASEDIKQETPKSLSPVPSDKGSIKDVITERNQLTEEKLDTSKSVSPVPSEKYDEQLMKQSESNLPESGILSTPTRISPVPSDKSDTKESDKTKLSQDSKEVPSGSPIPSGKDDSKPSEKEDEKLHDVKHDTPKSISPDITSRDEKPTQQDKEKFSNEQLSKTTSPVPSEKMLETEVPQTSTSSSPVPSEKGEIKREENIQEIIDFTPKSVSPVPSEKDVGKDLDENKLLGDKQVSPKSISPVPSEKADGKDLDESRLLDDKQVSPKSISPVPSEKDVSKDSGENKLVSDKQMSPKSVSPDPSEKDGGTDLVESRLLDDKQVSPKSISPVPSKKEVIKDLDENKLVCDEHVSPKSISPVPSEKDGGKDLDESRLLDDKQVSPKSISPVPSEKDGGKDLDESRLLDDKQVSPKSISPVPSEKDGGKDLDESRLLDDKQVSPKSISPVPSEKDGGKDLDESRLLDDKQVSPKSISPVPSEKDGGKDLDESRLLDDKQVSPKSISPVPSEKDVSKALDENKLVGDKQVSPKSTSPVPSEKDGGKDLDESRLSDDKQVSPKSISPVPNEKDVGKDLEESRLSDDKQVSPKSTSPVPSEKDGGKDLYESRLSDDKQVSPKSISPVPSEKDGGKNLGENRLLDDKLVSPKSVSPVPSEKVENLIEKEESQPLKEDDSDNSKNLSSFSDVKGDDKSSDKNISLDDKHVSPKSISPVLSEKDEAILSKDEKSGSVGSVHGLEHESKDSEKHKLLDEKHDTPKSISPVPSERDLEKEETKIFADSPKSASPLPSDKGDSTSPHKTQLLDEKFDTSKSTSPTPSDKGSVKDEDEDRKKSVKDEKQDSSIHVSPEPTHKVLSPVPSEKSDDKPIENGEEKIVKCHQTESPKSTSPVPSEKDESNKSILPNDKHDTPKSVTPTPSGKDNIEQLDTDEKVIKDDKSDTPKTTSSVPSTKHDFKNTEKHEAKLLDEDEQDTLKSISPLLSRKDDEHLESESAILTKDGEESTLSLDTRKKSVTGDSTESKSVDEKHESPRLSPISTEKESLTLLRNQVEECEKAATPKSTSPVPIDSKGTNLSLSEKDQINILESKHSVPVDTDIQKEEKKETSTDEKTHQTPSSSVHSVTKYMDKDEVKSLDDISSVTPKSTIPIPEGKGERKSSTEEKTDTPKSVSPIYAGSDDKSLLQDNLESIEKTEPLCPKSGSSTELATDDSFTSKATTTEKAETESSEKENTNQTEGKKVEAEEKSNFIDTTDVHEPDVCSPKSGSPVSKKDDPFEAMTRKEEKVCGDDKMNVCTKSEQNDQELLKGSSIQEKTATTSSDLKNVVLSEVISSSSHHDNEKETDNKLKQQLEGATDVQEKGILESLQSEKDTLKDNKEPLESGEVSSDSTGTTVVGLCSKNKLDHENSSSSGVKVEHESQTGTPDKYYSDKLDSSTSSSSLYQHLPSALNGHSSDESGAAILKTDAVIDKPLDSKDIKTAERVKTESESVVPSKEITSGIEPIISQDLSDSYFSKDSKEHKDLDIKSKESSKEEVKAATEKDILSCVDRTVGTNLKETEIEEPHSTAEEIKSSTSSSVHRMLVTGSSEDGGTETELCSSSVAKMTSDLYDKHLGNVFHKDSSRENLPEHTQIQSSSKDSSETQEKLSASPDMSDSSKTEKTIITTIHHIPDSQKEADSKGSPKQGEVIKTITTTITKTFGEQPTTDVKTTEECVIVQEIQKPSLPTEESVEVESAKGAKSTSEINSSGVVSQSFKKEISDAGRSGTPASDMASEREFETGGPSTPHSDISSGQVSRAATNVWGESSEGRPDSRHCDSDDDIPCSPMSVTSHIAQSPPQFDFDVHQHSKEGFYEETSKLKETSIPSAMTSSFYGSLPEEDPLDDYLREKKPSVGESQMYSSMYVSKYGDDDHEPSKPFSIEGTSQFATTFSSAKEDIDFETAIKEHRSVRGEDLTRFTNGKKEPETVDKTEVNGKSVHSEYSTNGLGKQPHLNGKSSQPDSLEFQETLSSSSASTSSVPPKSISSQVTSTFSSSSAKPSAEGKKDPIEGWGKPLGLPPPPKNLIESPLSKSTLTLVWNPADEWGIPLGLPSPAPPPVKKDSINGDFDPDITTTSNKTTPKKVARRNAENNKSASNTPVGKEASNKPKHPESPIKRASSKDSRAKSVPPVYMDLTYVPHHGNSHYTSVEFFKRVRARYYVFSGTEPSREVFNALLEAKQTWEDKDLEVTIIPTYDTDTLGYWVAENEDILAKYKIDLSPSASRCTINLQDHETSCSAYRLEF